MATKSILDRLVDQLSDLASDLELGLPLDKKNATTVRSARAALLELMLPHPPPPEMCPASNEVAPGMWQHTDLHVKPGPGWTPIRRDCPVCEAKMLELDCGRIPLHRRAR